MITGEVRASDLLEEAEREFEKFYWEGTFADYLDLMIENPTNSRLAHRRVYDAIMNEGVLEKPSNGSPTYRLFETQLFGRDDTIERIVEYFASAGRRLETRKRILLLLGPPASGKSTIVALLKYALERFTRTDGGAVYGIKGCPMQEEPLHLIPHSMRKKLQDEHGLYIEGDLCPRCRFVVRTQYGGKISQVPVSRVVFSEQEAVGIGHYVATSSPTDASLLVGSVDTGQLQGDRLEVAGKAFRLDGELNVANRGLMEFGDMFKADSHLLTTLLGLAQEQLIKMDRFGSVYADEVLIAHSNEGDFKAFMGDESTEALRDRIVRIYVPYNLRVSEEVKIYQNMLTSGGMETIHIPPLTLPAISTFAILSRMEPPSKQGVSLIDKLRA
ncbi:MAG: protein prkA, partial [Chloroflexi bacterium]|nr:protein prkA [Chloroflexota bacterium]